MNRRDFIKGVGASAISVAVIAESANARPPIAELKPKRSGQADVFTGDYPEDMIIDLSTVRDYDLIMENDHVETLGGPALRIATRERVNVTIDAPHQAVLDWLHDVSGYRQPVRLILKAINRNGEMKAISWDSQAGTAVDIINFPAIITQASISLGNPSMPPQLCMEMERCYG